MEKKIMSKKVACYCRVSTGNQFSGLEAQVRALREYCNRNGISDYVIYEDENQSGVKQSRPALDRMMKDVREGMIEKVIVYSFSRYARSVTHLLRALEEFKNLKIGFVSITDYAEFGITVIIPRKLLCRIMAEHVNVFHLKCNTCFNFYSA
jgi:DNA invertase Pin-like site-specific DNA recombinase